jgi:predicted nucleic acid-binding protein
MPDVQFAGIDVSIPRNIALLDTNVLVAYFDASDGHHDDATLVMEECEEYVWVLTPPVITEAAALIARRLDNLWAVRMILWMVTLERTIILPANHHIQPPEAVLQKNADLMSKHVIDYVDSYLMDLADSLSHKLELKPSTPIATFDKRDFFRCAGKGLRYSVYSTDDLELIEF